MAAAEIDLSPVVESVSFTTDVRALRAAVRHASAVAPRRAAMPVLEHVQIDARDSRVTIGATNLDADLRLSVPADVRESGVVLVGAKLLTDSLARAKGEVTIEVRGSSLHVRTNAGWFVLPTCPASDYPAFPETTTRAAVVVAGGDLSRIVRRVTYAMSADETRQHLFGALLEFEAAEGVLRVVATDGHRLVVASAPSTGRALFCLVHRSAIEALARLDLDDDAEVRIHVSESRVHFVGREVHVSGRIVDAVFPAWHQVIPGAASGSISFDRKEMLGALRAVATRPRGGVRIEIAPEPSSITLTTDDGDGHVASIELSAAIDGVPPHAVGLEARYLREMLTSLDDDRVTVELDGELDPVKVTSSDGTIGVCMPMRI